MPISKHEAVQYDNSAHNELMSRSIDSIETDPDKAKRAIRAARLALNHQAGEGEQRLIQPGTIPEGEQRLPNPELQPFVNPEE